MPEPMALLARAPAPSTAGTASSAPSGCNASGRDASGGETSEFENMLQAGLAGRRGEAAHASQPVAAAGASGASSAVTSAAAYDRTEAATGRSAAKAVAGPVATTVDIPGAPSGVSASGASTEPDPLTDGANTQPAQSVESASDSLAALLAYSAGLNSPPPSPGPPAGAADPWAADRGAQADAPAQPGIAVERGGSSTLVPSAVPAAQSAAAAGSAAAPTGQASTDLAGFDALAADAAQTARAAPGLAAAGSTTVPEAAADAATKSAASRGADQPNMNLRAVARADARPDGKTNLRADGRTELRPAPDQRSVSGEDMQRETDAATREAARQSTTPTAGLRPAGESPSGESRSGENRNGEFRTAEPLAGGSIEGRTHTLDSRALETSRLDAVVRADMAQRPDALAFSGPERSASAVPTAYVEHTLGAPGWDQAFGSQVSVLVSRREPQAEIRLNPPQLGPVEVRIELKGDQVSLAFSAPQADTRAAIENALPHLREMLAGNGLALGNASVNAETSQQQPGARPTHRMFHAEQPVVPESAPLMRTTATRLVDTFA